MLIHSLNANYLCALCDLMCRICAQFMHLFIISPYLGQTLIVVLKFASEFLPCVKFATIRHLYLEVKNDSYFLDSIDFRSTRFHLDLRQEMMA